MNSQRRLRLVTWLNNLGLDPDSDVGQSVGFDRMQPLEEALSHSSAGRALNHEQLEFYGDAVLRLAAAEFLRQDYPSFSVGERSALRAQLVSDRWLAELARSCDLLDVVQLGAAVAADPVGLNTILAETCEALIGAIYLAWGGTNGGMRAVLIWLRPHWQHSAEQWLKDPDCHNWKSALQEWSQGEGHGLPSYRTRERNRNHGDPTRFECSVSVAGRDFGEGLGRSRRQAEQQAARHALATIKCASES